MVGRIQLASTRKVPSNAFPGHVQHGVMHLDRSETDAPTDWNRQVGRRARTQVWNARRVDLSRWRPVGGGVLVAKGAFQDFDSTDTDRDLRGCQLRGATPGAIGWSRSQSHWITRSFDAPGTCRHASHVDGGPMS